MAYVKTPIGQSNFALSSYFVDIGDVTAIQVVNAAQTAGFSQISVVTNDDGSGSGKGQGVYAIDLSR